VDSESEYWSALADAEFEPLPDWLQTLIEGQPCADWAVKAWNKAANVPGSWFDQAKADAIVAMWATLFKLTINRFAGHPFHLSWWQEIIVRLMVGWKRPIEEVDPATGKLAIYHVRVFSDLSLWIPRKNGKTEFLAALALLFWWLDGVKGGEGYVFARNAEQAEVPFGRIAEMVKQLPTREATQFQLLATSIYCPALGTSLQLLTGAAEGKHGKAPYVRLGDEMHEWTTRKIEDDLRQGSGTYLQPIGLRASTAGVKTSIVGMAMWEETVAMLDGTGDESSTLAVIFAASADDDWTDETTWAKANPNLRVSVTLDSLRKEYVKAKRNKRAEAYFRCYHLNQWVDATTSWIDIRQWDKCTADRGAWKSRRAEMAGKVAYGGLDLSSRRDITSLQWLFPPDADAPAWRQYGRYWIPEAALDKRETRFRDELQKFIDLGILTVMPGEVIDQEIIMAAVLEGVAEFDVLGVGFDQWQAEGLRQMVIKQGVEEELMVQVPMNIRSLALASTTFEELVYTGKFDHGGDPLLRWMARHVVTRMDSNLNFMPDKKRSGEKIDGIVSSVMALALADQEKEGSVYETHGVRVI
jgi:phage terminase large subunit-like protein